MAITLQTERNYGRDKFSNSRQKGDKEMLKLKDLKLSLKLIIVFSVVIIISLMTIFSIVLNKFYVSNVLQAENLASEITKSNSISVAGDFERVSSVLKAFRGSLLYFRDNKSLSREQIVESIGKEVQATPGILAMYTLWEANAFDNNDSSYINKPGHDSTGRFIPYVSRSGDKVNIEPLTDYDKEGAGDYYLQPKKTLKVSLIEPYMYKVNGVDVLITSITIPIIDSTGKFVGMVGADIELSYLQEVIKKIQPMGGYAELVSSKGIFVANGQDENLIQKGLSDQGDAWKTVAESLAIGKEVSTYQKSSNGSDSLYKFRPINIDGSDANWSFGISIPKANIISEYTSMVKVTVILVILSLIIMVGIIAFLVNRFTKPLNYAVNILNKVADGELNVSIDDSNVGRDEVGKLISGLKKTVESQRGVIGSIVEIAESLGAASEELLATSEEATAASGQIATTLGLLATGASSQAKSVSETSSVVDQLSESSQHVVASTEGVSESSIKAASDAKLGVIQVKKAIDKINQISKAASQTAKAVENLGVKSNEIGQIVDVITGIADQTNLLALNAAIEAARAGEQGRGFAVVADEVRKLAEQSSESAAKITTLVSSIQTETEKTVVMMERGTVGVAEGVEAVNIAGDSFKSINESIESIVLQIKQVTDVSSMMATRSAKAVGYIESINVVAEQAAATMQEASAASEEQSASMVYVSQSAESLAELGGKLSNLVARFRV